ncbi:MAG TPA: enoyl-CoA hydratase/isomerase family protein [Alphaproteobacteria bacterium]|nr:enoyl-CoA hydratase/isomerase family protein [Alphaproteobacteria bacterium]
MHLETVIYEKRDAIAIISFNKPEVLNAEGIQMTRDFLAALKEAKADDDVKVVIIKGEGRAFCSGHDLSEDTAGETVEKGLVFLEILQDTTRTILNMGKPVIAAVHGYALGAGCEWAMNCDIRIAAEGSKFGFPETSVGTTVTNAGTKLLPLLVGLGRAKELVFANEMIDAAKAEKWGLVNRVVPLDTLNDAVLDLAVKIAKNSLLALRLSKAALNRGSYQDFEQTLEVEAKDVILCAYGSEGNELTAKALEKIK